jgi:hypothetical protein
LRLKREFRPSRISAPTGTGAIQIAPDPGKPGVFSVYNYIGHLNKKVLLLLEDLHFPINPYSVVEDFQIREVSKKRRHENLISELEMTNYLD